MLSIYSNRAKLLVEGNPDDPGSKDYLDFLTTNGCRRIPMSRYFDGEPVDCRGIQGAFCDRCLRDRQRGGLNSFVRPDLELPTSSAIQPVYSSQVAAPKAVGASSVVQSRPRLPSCTSPSPPAARPSRDAPLLEDEVLVSVPSRLLLFLLYLLCLQSWNLPIEGRWMLPVM